MKVLLPEWSLLKLVQKKKLVNSTYIWLLLVPVFAKLFSKLEDVLEFKINSVVYIVDFVLPFSWQMFYLSALSFVIGNILYLLISPKIIKDFNGYGDFKEQGKLESDIDSYMNAKERNDEIQLQNLYASYTNEKKLKFEVSQNTNDEYHANINEKHKFWNLFNDHNSSRVKGRILCSCWYVLGFSFLLYVVIENIYWTLNQILALW